MRHVNVLSLNARYELVKAMTAWHQYVELDKEDDNSASIRELEAGGLVKPQKEVCDICFELTTEGYLVAFWLSGCNPLLLRDSVKGARA
jgi:competence protein ComGC